jgi:nitrite reductase/ring-hydroxylating ferredoxin subunit
MSGGGGGGGRGGGSLPVWKEDFPIAWADDHFVTRREFTKSLVAVSCAAFAANATLVGLGALGPGAAASPRQPLRLATAAGMPVRSARLFTYDGQACLLIRHAPDRFVAFAQKCTHLGCTVLYRPERQALACPCHEGLFDAETGKVLAGPPPRPLPVVTLEGKGEDLWATGISR